jgi:3-hydroxyisobutyrate dehydrogenase-like beta-hydroxyacid dehydrogenase
MSEAASAKGAIFVDAPVSGGVNAASAGTLTFMVGADKDDHFAAAQKILAHMGKSITHCGQVNHKIRVLKHTSFPHAFAFHLLRACFGSVN